MNLLPTTGKYYALFCLAACGYFSMAAVQGWTNPLGDLFTGENAFFAPSSGHSYSSGSYHGRSSGGFGGGGK